MLAYSTFGSSPGERAEKVREAVRILDSRKVDFEYDGEIERRCGAEPSVMKVLSVLPPVGAGERAGHAGAPFGGDLDQHAAGARRLDRARAAARRLRHAPCRSCRSRRAIPTSSTWRRSRPTTSAVNGLSLVKAQHARVQNPPNARACASAGTHHARRSNSIEGSEAALAEPSAISPVERRSASDRPPAARSSSRGRRRASSGP